MKITRLAKNGNAADAKVLVVDDNVQVCPTRPDHDCAVIVTGVKGHAFHIELTRAEVEAIADFTL